MKNPNCDNDKCISEAGEVRVLPTGGDSNAILCRACFDYELRFRKERNRNLSKDCQFQLPKWEDLKVYGELPTPRPELSFDGHGINGPDEYRSRLATFVEGVAGKQYGKLFAAAPELRAALDRLLRSPDLNLDTLEPETVAAIRQAEWALNQLK